MTIEDLIRAANPVPPGDVPAGDSPAAERLLALVQAAPASRRNARRRPAARLALAGAAAAGLAAVAVVVTRPGPAARPAGGPAPAAFRPAPVPAWMTGPVPEGVRTLVLDAARQPASPVPGPGQYQYVAGVSLNEIDALDAPGYAVRYSEHLQSWVGWNGSGRQVQTWADPRFPTARDRAHWIARGRPSLAVSPTDLTFGPHQLSTAPGRVNLSQVTTNPARLAALISSRQLEGGPPGAAEDFGQVGDLLRYAGTPPALRAALFQVAARIPGVTLIENAADHSGRAGIGVQYADQFTQGPDAGDTRLQELIFNPATSDLIAEQTATADPRTHVTTVDAWTDYLVSAVVSSMTATTPGAGGS